MPTSTPLGGLPAGHAAASAGLLAADLVAAQQELSKHQPTDNEVAKGAQMIEELKQQILIETAKQQDAKLLLQEAQAAVQKQAKRRHQAGLQEEEGQRHTKRRGVSAMLGVSEPQPKLGTAAAKEAAAAAHRRARLQHAVAASDETQARLGHILDTTTDLVEAVQRLQAQQAVAEKKGVEDQQTLNELLQRKEKQQLELDSLAQQGSSLQTLQKQVQEARAADAATQAVLEELAGQLEAAKRSSEQLAVAIQQKEALQEQVQELEGQLKQQREEGEALEQPGVNGSMPGTAQQPADLLPAAAPAALKQLQAATQQNVEALVKLITEELDPLEASCVSYPIAAKALYKPDREALEETMVKLTQALDKARSDLHRGQAQVLSLTTEVKELTSQLDAGAAGQGTDDNSSPHFLAAHLNQQLHLLKQRLVKLLKSITEAKDQGVPLKTPKECTKHWDGQLEHCRNSFTKPKEEAGKLQQEINSLSSILRNLQRQLATPAQQPSRQQQHWQ